jgi:hypothetical protein
VRQPRDWKDADRVSDLIVDLANEQININHIAPIDLFVGQLLGLLSLLKMPPEVIPPEIILLEMQIRLALGNMLYRTENVPEGKKQ